MKVKKLIFTLAALVIIAAALLSFTSCANLGAREKFDDFLDELFHAMLRNDAITVNILISNPEALELTGIEASHYLPATSASEHKERYQFYIEVANEVLKYNFKSLTAEQKKIYNLILDYFAEAYLDGDYFYFQDMLGGSSGYNVNFPFYLDVYKFQSTNDIENYIKLIDTLPEAFDAYVAYERTRCANGYGRADFVYQSIIDQAESFAPQGEDGEHYLISEFAAKLAASGLSLSTQDTQNYISRNLAAVTYKMLPAYRKLAADFEDIMTEFPTSQRNQLGLEHYEDGADYYAYLFRRSTGAKESVQEALSDILKLMTDFHSKYITLLNSLNTRGVNISESMSDLYSDNDYSFENISSMLESLKTAVAADFPAMHASTPAPTVKFVSENLRESYNPASYFSSAIDDSAAEEVIFVNPPADPNDGYVLFDLLSHEGYPGHLYQHSVFKNTASHKMRHLLHYGGYDEGWGEYAQIYSAKYFYPGTVKNDVYRLYQYGNFIFGLERAAVDIMVNYYGYDADELLIWLQNNSKRAQVTAEIAEALLKDAVELPAVVIKYYYGYLKFAELKEAFRKKLGQSYTDLAFHTAVIEAGPMPFNLLKDSIL
ncbi:MAG: DUF885 domain-containing protein [Christensenellales bacterium]|jgi:uncharacterized protein (DUF885 family)